MAKKAYVGVNGQPHNGTALYVGVNNVPRKVVKGYVGVNGVPCVFWDKTAPPVIIPSWNIWATLNGDMRDILEELPVVNLKKFSQSSWTYIDVDLIKSNNYIQYFGIFKRSQEAVWFFIMSLKGADYKDSTGESYSYKGTITDINGASWRFANYSYKNSEYDLSDYLINDTVYSSENDRFQMASDLLGMILSVPFYENYRSGQTYTLYTDSAKKMILKALSTWLHTNSDTNPAPYSTNPAYKAISDNAKTIINYILNAITTNCGSSIVPLVQIAITGETEVAIYVQFGTTYSIGTTDQVTGCALTYTETNRGYTRHYFETHDYPEGYFVYETSAYPDWLTLIEADSSGNLTYTTMDAWETQTNMIEFAAGLGIEKPSGSNFYNVEMTNLGINL